MIESKSFQRNEIWKTSFYGVHEVSNFGHVRNKKTKKRVNPVKKSSGYLQISAMVNGKIKSLRLHRVVAQAFIDNTNKLPQVNHINGIKSDNRVVNLEWCSGRKNIKHCYKMLGVNHKKVKPVLMIDNCGNVQGFVSAREASRQTGVLHQSIYKCCKKKRKSAGGYRWMYNNDQEMIEQNSNDTVEYYDENKK